MSNPMKLINDILVDLFKNILDIEEQALKDRGIIDLSMNEMHTLEAIGYEDVKTMKSTDFDDLKKYYLKLVAGQMLYKHLLFELPA